jgi:peptidoglycan/xylan/chitin deacetylase (PgdA/CDA1 family)
MAENRLGYFILIPIILIASLILFLVSPHTQIIYVPPPTTNQSPSKIHNLPTSTPTPKPLTFSQMSSLYGPCVHLPVLMYHHIQDLVIAKTAGHLSLTVSPSVFAGQLQYLADHNYKPVSPLQLIDFFDHQTPLPTKPVMLTFDDGYEDFYQNAFPQLKTHNFPAILFLPTGLTNNPDYITWVEAKEMSGSKLVEISNHTWSHQTMKSDSATDLREIQTADNQLSEKNLNSPKVFAYPYGTVGKFAQNDLQSLNYSLAFTTSFGTTLCSKNRLQLPRVRIGNSGLQNYGL